jgi:hypothetical protein
VISLVLVSAVHHLVNTTLSFSKWISDHPIAKYVGFDGQSIERMEAEWKE